MTVVIGVCAELCANGGANTSHSVCLIQHHIGGTPIKMTYMYYTVRLRRRMTCAGIRMTTALFPILIVLRALRARSPRQACTRNIPQESNKFLAFFILYVLLYMFESATLGSLRGQLVSDASQLLPLVWYCSCAHIALSLTSSDISLLVCRHIYQRISRMCDMNTSPSS